MAFEIRDAFPVQQISPFRKKLLRWYSSRARALPWRTSADPYRIWVSEIMLQQTTVVAVVPYFQRFLSRFPTILELAQAEEAEVLRHWEGLGYYSRARNMLRAAQEIVSKHEGIFPSELTELHALPGIGRYTAGAIASFAFDARAPIVEANTLRLYCRLLGYRDDPRTTEGQETLWQFAESLLPRSGSGQLNQALMDLGATVCTPRQPSCPECPVQTYCRAYHEGTTAEIPRPKARPIVTDVTEASVAVRHGSKYLLRRRTPNERWAGLWDFIRFEVEQPAPDSQSIAKSVYERTGLTIEPGELITRLKHGVTRYRITLHCHVATRINGRLKTGEEWQWLAPADFETVPLSVTARKFAVRLKGLNFTDSAAKAHRRES